MARMTIDYGIDLGTTNSSIAVLQDHETKVIENNEGQKYTPSVIWIDKKERLYVGNRAKNQIEFDPENSYSEFKLQMGSSETYTFQNTDRLFKPEDLSAEVIKSLRDDVRQHMDEDVTAAVITVPAAFELPQCEATTQAAKLAGLTDSPLVQEPVAAALAYGFQHESKNTFWLIYDIGGGTFDAAIVCLRGGSIQILNHGGDNHLGGKLVDWAIVENLFVPVLQEQYHLPDFNRGNQQYRSAFAKLKRYAEEAKIELSRYDSTQIYIDPLCQDHDGNWIAFDFELTRHQLESINIPFTRRSLGICKQVLSESKLGIDDIEKMILVGGPSQSPMIREYLFNELGIPLEYSIDPLTVVSRGAAVFAGTQKRTRTVSNQQPHTGVYQLDLEYEAIDNEPEPLDIGKVQSPESLDQWSIEFVETESKWRSGLIPLQENGKFMTNLLAQRGRGNHYAILLRDPQGTQFPTDPNQMSYIIGNTITAQPLIHSIGVALANNRVTQFLKKGSELPLRHRQVFQTTQDIKKGESGAFLNIPIVEGESLEHADRNSLIGTLQVNGVNIRRDVKAGSEVEITIVIDESRQVHALAYIPVLDEEFEEVLRLEKSVTNWDALESQIRNEKRRMVGIREKVQQTGHKPALEILKQLENERLIPDLDQSLLAARTDHEARDICQTRLLDLKKSLDTIENSMEWPNRVWDAQQLIIQIEEKIEDENFSSYRTIFLILREQIESAIEQLNLHELQIRLDQLHEVHKEILLQDPEYWIGCFYYLQDQKDNMKDPINATRWIQQGQKALATHNPHLLESIVRQLITLLPEQEQTEMYNALNSTIMPLTQA